MHEALKYLENVIDEREQHKVLHKMSDIIAVVFYATGGNANEWPEIAHTSKYNEEYLRK